jgi:BioD-like phosphotransacetylase family protein
MIPLYINSTETYSGKTMLTLGLGMRFKRDGYRLGYLKPLGWLPVTVDGEVADQDAVFMKKALDLEESLDQICPVVMTQDLIERVYEGKEGDFGQKIMETFRRFYQDKDVVLVGGAGSLFEGGFIGARGVDLAAAMDAKILLVDLFRNGITTIDSFLYAREILKERLIGGVINRVRPEKMEYVRKKVLPFLLQREVDILGVIPDDRTLGAVSVRHLANILCGSVVCGEQRLEELVEGFMVGAMSPEHALQHFQRRKNIAVITGGDRPDIQLAALETAVKGIILTGGFRPNDIIISRAMERGVPLIMVELDTFSVVQRFEEMLGRLELREERKVERAKELVERIIDFPLLYRKLGLSPAPRS